MVAAEHYFADAIIHFGHSCLSVVDKMPVYYVFEKLPLDLESIQADLNNIKASNQEEKLIILYDVSYCYLYGKN